MFKFTPLVCPILCRLNFKSMFLYQFNYFCGQVLKFCALIDHRPPHLHPSKGVNLAKKRCELKIFQKKISKPEERQKCYVL
jgi:hypothetical protein